MADDPHCETLGDSRPDVAAAMKASADPWPTAQAINTTTSPDVTLARAEALVRHRLGRPDR